MSLFNCKSCHGQFFTTDSPVFYKANLCDDCAANVVAKAFDEFGLAASHFVNVVEQGVKRILSSQSFVLIIAIQNYVLDQNKRYVASNGSEFWLEPYGACIETKEQFDKVMKKHHEV